MNSDLASAGASPPVEQVQIDLDLEIEIVENYMPPPHGSLLAKCKIKAKPPTSNFPSNMLTTASCYDPVDVDMLSDSSAVASTSATPLCSPSTLSECDSILPKADFGYPALWPKNYQTYQIVNGYCMMDLKKMMVKFPTVEEWFLRCLNMVSTMPPTMTHGVDSGL